MPPRHIDLQAACLIWKRRHERASATVPASAAYARLAFIAANSSGAAYYLDNAYLGDPA